MLAYGVKILKIFLFVKEKNNALRFVKTAESCYNGIKKG